MRLEFHVAARGDLARSRDGFGREGEFFRHRFRRENGEIVFFHAHAVIVRQLVAGLYGEEHVVVFRVLGMDIMAVLCRDERDAGFFRERDERSFYFFRVGKMRMFLDLKEIVPFAENRFVFLRDRFRGIEFILKERLADLAAQAGGERDHAAVIFAEQVFVHARPVVESFKMRLGHERHDVLPAGVVLGEQDQMVVTLIAFFREAVARRDIGLDAQDRFHARFFRRLIKFDRAVERAVIGERDAIHAELLGARHEFGDLGEAVEQGIVRMDVKMGEFRHDGYYNTFSIIPAKAMSSRAATRDPGFSFCRPVEKRGLGLIFP